MADITLPPQSRGPDLDIGNEKTAGRLGKPVFINWMEDLGFDPQFGPFYLGFWGAAAFIFAGAFTFIWLMTMLQQVGYNALAFIK